MRIGSKAPMLAVDAVDRALAGADCVAVMVLEADRMAAADPAAGTDPAAASAKAEQAAKSANAPPVSKEAAPAVGRIQSAGAVAFATSPGSGRAAPKGPRNVFTAALVRTLSANPGMDIATVMSLTTGDVITATHEEQRPWLNARLIAPLVLGPSGSQ